MYNPSISEQLGEAHRRQLLAAGARSEQLRAARQQCAGRRPEAVTPGRGPLRSALGWWMVEAGLRLVGPAADTRLSGQPTS